MNLYIFVDFMIPSVLIVKILVLLFKNKANMKPETCNSELLPLYEILLKFNSAILSAILLFYFLYISLFLLYFYIWTNHTILKCNGLYSMSSQKKKKIGPQKENWCGEHMISSFKKYL